MHIKNKRGQSTVEYVLLVTAVLAVVIAFVVGQKSPFQTQLNQAYNTATQGMNVEGEQLSSSHNPSPPSTSPTAGTPGPGYVVNVD